MTSERRTQQEIVFSLLAKPGLRCRIDASCVSCIYDPFVRGSWRKQVEECSIPSCPSFDVRPRSTAKRPKTDPIVVEPDPNHSVSPITQENTLKGVINRAEIDSQIAEGSPFP